MQQLMMLEAASVYSALLCRSTRPRKVAVQTTWTQPKFVYMLPAPLYGDCLEYCTDLCTMPKLTTDETFIVSLTTARSAAHFLTLVIFCGFTAIVHLTILGLLTSY
uniref:(northern house mosquito) hypothetical protein n=1 Tax=Culex pipiens TaxID=7175 RepID=A0A8D8DJ78_CULPI